MDNIALVLMNRMLGMMTSQSSPCHLLLTQPTDQVYWGWEAFSSIILSKHNHKAGGRAYLRWENTPILSLLRAMGKVASWFRLFVLLASLFPLFCAPSGTQI